MPKKKITKKNDHNGRKRENRRIFDLQTNHKTTKKMETITNTIPQQITVNVPSQYADIVLTAYLKHFASQGVMLSPTSVAFDFVSDANEYKQCLHEEFDVKTSEMQTIVRFTKDGHAYRIK